MEYLIDKFKKEILEAVKTAASVNIDLEQLEISSPPDPAMGDLAVSCFYLTKLLRISPNQVALELKDKIRKPSFVKAVQNVGPYLNFFLEDRILAEKVIKEIEKKGDKYGSGKKQAGTVMLEYSGPNTHKEFHVGHIRNNILGSSLVNLLRFSGRKLIAVNYIGDIGAHVAKCLWAYDKFHKKDELPENKGKYLGQIYAEAVKKIEENSLLAGEVSEVQKKLEAGDKYWTKLWKETRQWSLTEFNELYKIIGAKFDHVFYESEVEKPGKKIVEELLAQGIAKKSQGAVIIDLEKYNLKQLLLLKSDGSSLYSTKELALAKLKFEKYKIDESYMVIDSRQSFYLKQFFKTLEVMGFDKKVMHIPYEFLTLKDGAMSSRKGNIVSFEDFFEQAVAIIIEDMKKRHSNWSSEEIETTAKKIALAAIKLYMLRVSNNSVITFDFEEAKNYDGFTGPYLQYTVSRINSILKKENVKSLTDVDFSKLDQPKEKELLLMLMQFPEIIRSSVQLMELSRLAKYLFDLSKVFSSYYQEVSILNSEVEHKKARLALIQAVRQTLVNGLGILGIEVLDRM